MSAGAERQQPRVLVIDDNAAIHNDFRKILVQSSAATRLDEMEKELFGPVTAPIQRAGFRIESAYQGQEALGMVQRALQEGDPYVLAFVDIRMPPGWDGIETLERLWQCYPELQAVICTAHSDYSWDDIARRLAQPDSLLILKKPFDTAEVLQIAHSLSRKWELARQAKLRMEDLDRMVRERTQELRREVEERARVQAALQVSEERFSKAFIASPIAMAIQNEPEGRFLDANPSFLQLTGYSAEQLVHRTGAELRLWESGQAQGEAAVLPQGRLRKHSGVLRRGDGSFRNTVLWAEPVVLESGPCLLMIVEDVTDHLRLEAQLRQSQKLEAVGCLSAGIAHEFNNLLTVIQGHTGLLSGKALNTASAADSIERIAQASQRAASLTRRLLAFSRKQPLQLKPVNLSEAITGLGKMLEQLMGERFQIQMDCAAGLPPVYADEGNLGQILINLSLNARDAMAEGGSISIKTGLVALDAIAARRHLEARPGRFVCLSVADSGCGMSREVLGRIFDPFYTTKDVGKGTGLGLSTVHGIVQQHQGWIEVSSEVGKGSVFYVFLPACDDSRGVAPAEARLTPAPEPGGREAVLMVEDEGIVREAARLALERGGYRVFEAGDGPDALKVWEHCPAHIDLLVTDMVMPHGVSGGALARVLQARDPRLRVLYTSGYSSEVIREDRHLIVGVNFLRKPYDTASLLKAVRVCLDTQGQPGFPARNGAPEAAGRSPESSEAATVGMLAQS
ncbi:MAG TPA: response regulator [Candidatus Acidoferrum sp.]|nr:response regulator [Candidatus Acidoferrum sp.]